VIDHFCVLGLEEDASPEEVEEAFAYLSRMLNPQVFRPGSAAAGQAENCLTQITASYQVLRDPVRRLSHREEVLAARRNESAEEFRPFLGHICVAAGIITLDDLNDAISKQTDIDLPLGQILQERQLLSQVELDGLLMGQRLYGGQSAVLDAVTRRLLVLGLITKDMVKIALIDQRASMNMVPDLLAKRGWVEPGILRILQAQYAQPAAGSSSGNHV
jgi:hypothetical protein